MRATLMFLVIVLAMAAAFFYQRNPAGCAKLVDDLGASTGGFDKFKADLLPALTATSADASTNAAPVSPGSDDSTATNAPAANAPAVAATPTPKPAPTFAPPVKAWTPPDPIPAQANWTWMTSDGTTYQNVAVTKLGPETVSITHSMGVANDIPIASLPPEVQKQLNYDPVAAAAARRERKREEAHPYYPFADLAAAQDVARQMRWPLAWMDSSKGALDVANPVPESEADYTQRELNRLKTRTIVIWLEANDDLNSLPALVRDQLFILDDGPIPGGHHFFGPKAILTDPDITTALGRISHTQLKTLGDAAIDQALAALPTDSTAPSPAVAAAPSDTPVAAPAAPPAPAAAAPTASTPPTNAPVAATPPAPTLAPPPKAWTAPDPIPAQPNWIWTTSDGTIYSDVVITKLEAETVSITHSRGVAHDIPIANLPPDVQKELNYDPVAASAARAERKREEEHPYYPFAQAADALALAQQMHWPVAWMDSFGAYLSATNPAPDSEPDFTQRAIAISKTHAIVIFADGVGDFNQLPPLIHAQMIIMDDGPSIPGGHHFFAPKIIITNSDGTKALARISFTQMKAGGDPAIEQAYTSLTADSTAPATPMTGSTATP